MVNGLCNLIDNHNPLAINTLPKKDQSIIVENIRSIRPPRGSLERISGPDFFGWYLNHKLSALAFLAVDQQ